MLILFKILVSINLVKCQLFGDLLKRGVQHRPIAKRTQENYLECLKTEPKYKDPEALLLVEGNKLVLTCRICVSPSSPTRGVWKRLVPGTAVLVPVHLDGRHARVLADLSLEISSIRTSDAGVYFCAYGIGVKAKYAVDVVHSEPHSFMVMRGQKRRYDPSADIPLKDLNLVLGVSWSEWSQCNRCGSVVGRRRRIGVCTIRKMDLSSPSKPVDTQLLNEYKKGIPCRSSILPQEIKEMSTVQNKKSVFVIGFCKAPCPQVAGIVVVTDKNGVVLETVDNSKGIYSMQQPLPSLPLQAKRETMFEEVGNSLTISCPGNEDANFVTWRNESFVINPSKVHILTKGRVKIDLGNNLLIRKLQFTDSATYSCWNDKTLMGSMKLQVIEKSVQYYQMYIINIGVIFTFLIIVMMLSTCKNAKLDTKE